MDAGRPPLIPAGLDATLVLVRHGESDWITKGLFQGQGDSPLSARGLRQAQLVARRLATAGVPPVLPIPARPPLAIRHSPLQRAARTATEIAAAMAAAADDHAATAPRPEPDPGLLEIGQGQWEGLPGAEIAERWGDTLRRWRSDPLAAWAPDGESLPEVDVRVRASLRSILAELETEPRLGTRRRSGVLGYAEDLGDEPWTLLVGHDGAFKVLLLAALDLPLERFWLVPFALCGITVIEIRAGRPRLRLLNATDHLAELETEAERELVEEPERTCAF
ncbi:MAG TPA: histidine phosphatase family protein [Candidatus Limnocylindrales bacterium]|nr:histidine phosphatase family protein [Candidatus Limnocylindrales bacterium]